MTAYAGSDPLVLGIPRGGLVVAAEVARHLHAELDVMVVSKLHGPRSRDITIGAVTTNGGCLLNMDLIRRHRISSAYVGAITQVERGAALGREAWLRTFRPAAAWTSGRTVILVDDGMQTGATMRAAVAAVRRRLPGRVVAAVPIGSQRACAAVSREADELVCLEQAPRVVSLARWYGDFAPPGEADMRALLEGAAQAQEA